MLIIRVNLQDKLRRLGSNSQDDHMQVIEQKWQVLASMFVKLKQLQDTASIMAITHGHEPFVEDEGEFDETEETASASVSSQHRQQTKQGRDETGIEREPLTIPSNGNVGGEAIEVEIHH